MKSIFIVTDFSAASHNAALYGIELAKHFNSKVYLFHAYQAPVQVPESYVFYTTENVWETVNELLTKEAASINPDQSVAIEICGDEGAAANAIFNNAKKRDADLIICGMKASVKGLRRIFGSTTTALTRISDIPLLVIPEEAAFRKPEQVALACDMDEETAGSTVDLLKEIGTKFQSKLSVVWVVENNVDEEYKVRFQPSEAITHLKEMNPVFEFPKGSNITTALEEFAQEHSIDMMAVIPHKHNFLERFFVESTTTSLIFHTHIPLLVLPQKTIGQSRNVQLKSETEKPA